MIRTYSELIKLPTFEERLQYLLLKGRVGAETFGFDRWLNQHFYTSKLWRDDIRPKIIARDLGCDLGVEGYDIQESIIIHHMNPIATKDIVNCTPFLLNPEFLICTSFNTHQAIHYENAEMLKIAPIYFTERKPNDTCLWKTEEESTWTAYLTQ